MKVVLLGRRRRRFRYPFSLLMRFALLVVLLLGSAGCGGYIGRADQAYREGRYLEAEERLHEHEAQVGELSPRKQIEYGITRGMSLMMLGDYAGAERWMNYAYQVERSLPGSMTQAQRATLDRGFWNLQQAVQNLETVPRDQILPPPGAGALQLPGGENPQPER